MLKKIAIKLIERGERRTGVGLDYTRKIAQTDLRLLWRYNHIFSFLDPHTKVPAAAYHIARLRGAIAADCGSCVEAEINLACQSGVDSMIIENALQSNYVALSEVLSAVAQLTDSVVGRREDDPESRDIILNAYGDAGLIEISFAMNGAAMLPGIKRAMGYATACDLKTLRKRVG